VKDELDLTAYRNALAALDDALRSVADEKWFAAQPGYVQNTLVAGAIQSFEFVFELSVSMLRRRLELESPISAKNSKDSYRDLIRHAAEYGLITDVQSWFRYREMRNRTSHIYNKEVATDVYRGTLQFAPDAHALLVELERRNG
jgi:nucleotidyltransferase substrate binding protein (TIGR01987 family)